MKKNAIVALFAVLLLSLSVPSTASRFKRGADDNPYRLVGYAAHPIGIALEYAIMRPIHWVVSQHNTDIIFGHKANVGEEGTSFEWVHGDFTPTIAKESERTNQAAAARQGRVRSNNQATPNRVQTPDKTEKATPNRVRTPEKTEKATPNRPTEKQTKATNVEIRDVDVKKTEEKK